MYGLKHRRVAATALARSAAVAKPAAIEEQTCTGVWGVQIYVYSGYCISYGFVGSASGLSLLTTHVFTNNNYGTMTFNKDEVQYNNYKFSECQEYDFTHGTYGTATFQGISISGYSGSCASVSLIEVY